MIYELFYFWIYLKYSNNINLLETYSGTQRISRARVPEYTSKQLVIKQFKD